jgi:hypothetical protein
MSSAKPKKTKLIPPRPPQLVPSKPASSARAVTPTKSAIKKDTHGSGVKGDGRVHIANRPPTILDKGKGKAKGQSLPVLIVCPTELATAPLPSSVRPISVHSTADEDEEEDDFEEVPIPSGPSSPYPDTPGSGTNVTRHTTPGTVTTAPSVDDNFGDRDDEGESSASGSGTEGDGVIRVEIGGETPEEKAKRIALALRK